MGGERSPAVLVIVATYNERDNLPTLVERIFAAAPFVDVLVVDDNSPDGTGRWCDDYAAADSRLRCLHRPGKGGLGAAVLAGLERAASGGYEVAVNMDADLSHPPEVLPTLIELVSGPHRVADVAIGSRYIPGGGIRNWNWRRHVMSRLVNLYSRWVLRIPANDCSGGFRAYRLDLLARAAGTPIRSTGYAFFEEQLWRLWLAGARLAETPIVFINRDTGQSKANWREIAASGWHLLKLAPAAWGMRRPV
ncbi:MAG: hypothetical protein RLY70_4085 [Planctomycetota bacterium]|jgi:dolichol-phosphate mannosyltransferase